jgi:hypothetical protein
LGGEFIIGASSWSRRHWILTIAVAVILLTIYASIAPGLDYFGCYTWMVMEPERLSNVAKNVWTLNPPWLVPFMAFFVTLPGRTGYILFMAASLAMFIYSAYKLGGKPIPLLLSAHMMWILWWGQIEAWGVIAVVVGWYAMRRKSWVLAFIALTLASFKPQISLVPVLALWWWSGKDRWKSMIGLFILLLFSIWIWGPWPVWYWQGIFGFIGDGHYDSWNASLGLIGLPLFIPALLLPMGRKKRLIALTATAFIANPYMPYYSTIMLMTFAVPWWAYLFGILGYLPSIIGTQFAWNAIVLMPLLILVWLYMPIVQSWLQRSALIQSIEVPEAEQEANRELDE